MKQTKLGAHVVHS